MLVLFLMDKYLTKQTDGRFLTLWEGQSVKRKQLYIIGIMIYYIAAVALITDILLIGTNSLLISMLTFAVVAIVYGYLYIRTLLRFIGKFTSRYILVKSGQSPDTFDKSNVVN